MKSWILSVCITVIITTIVIIILPQGKLGKYIKNIFSLLVLLVILKPLIDFDYGSINVNTNFDIANIELQEDYLVYTSNMRVKNLEKDCEKIIKNLGIKNFSVLINYNLNDDYKIEINKVAINLKKEEIIGGESHIDIIEQIKYEIANYLSVDKNSVEIYGE